MNSSVFAGRIDALRLSMRNEGVSACIVPTSDPHLSEYLPERWQGRAWLSGFDGSAGTLVITQDFAGLWTDSRYWEQADQSLAGTGIATMRAGAPDVLDVGPWLASTLKEGDSVAVDGQVVALQSARAWEQALQKKGIVLHTRDDLLQHIWQDRPSLPQGKVVEHLPPFACRSRRDNLAQLRTAMQEHGAAWHVLSSLDDIAWLFNLRGDDVPYNPVFLAFAIIGETDARLFVDESKIAAALKETLAQDGVQIADYGAFQGALAALPAGDKVLVDPARTTIGTVNAAPELQVIEAINPSQLFKSRKTDAEVEHIRHSMEQDGAALCEFFAWFEGACERGEVITELTIDERITEARSRRPNFVCPSFSTIAAYQANGAMPHYHATPAAHARISGDGLLLIDSGGQYLGGTTDITRVVPVGTISEQEKHDYTMVLQGMIALSQAVFPRGIAAPMLDALARAPIWRSGAEFGHGTGHGVGYFLNVHEGPQSIGYRARINPHMAMEPGMITSNEPGLYRPGRWGIRIENLVLARPEMETEFGEFLSFETLTLCPIDTRCIVVEMLSGGERRWLNAYHAEVRERVAPLVEGDARAWLEKRTEPI